MNPLLLAVFLFSSLLLSAQWFTQMQDHFDPFNSRTWSQKYIIYRNTTPERPVFFFLGGEAPVEFFEFQEVSSRNWAEEFDASYIALEHRFYGVSNPTNDLSTRNLRFLSSQQALADAAYFIEEMKSVYTGPWVVFGCSYSGALSAWFRTKYPNLVVGSVAPSGPILAKYNYTDFFHNFDLVAPPSCLSATAAAVKTIDVLTRSHSGLTYLGQKFHSCNPLTSQDIPSFKWLITEWLSSSAQWQNPPGWMMTNACLNLTQTDSFVENWGSAMFANSQPANCLDFTEASIDNPMKAITLGNADRSWMFQKCTEFAYYQVGYPNSSVFFSDMPSTLQERRCLSVFGSPLVPRVEWTNSYYGGLNIEGSNIAFTNGLFDPWHRLSAQEPQNPSQQTIFYEAAHCAPMTQPTPQDPPSLTKARVEIVRFLKKILKM